MFLQEFHNIYRQFFPHGDPTKFANFVFNVFDANKVRLVPVGSILKHLKTYMEYSVHGSNIWKDYKNYSLALGLTFLNYVNITLALLSVALFKCRCYNNIKNKKMHVLC